MTFRRAGPGIVVTIVLAALLSGSAALEDGHRPGVVVGGDDTGLMESQVPAEVELLARWDRQRAAAYSRRSTPALRALYRPGSRTGRADLRLLAAWTRRGLRVHGLRTQLLAYDVGERSAHRRELTVTDRMQGAFAVGPRRCGRCPRLRVRLPAGQPEKRTIRFLRGEAGWVVDEVWPAAPP